MDEKPPHPSTTQPAAPPEPFEKLSKLAVKDGFKPRQMASFVARGLRVVRPGGGRATYCRQSWLEAFLTGHATSSTKEIS